ncbi:hypothetical protein TNCV_2095771 [Trichonephila clavipes]|nr:hypothetical protein TNCV_2095771 [Trichonephila clavipes]
MNEDLPVYKKIFNALPIVPRKRGRPNLRWIDGLEKDLLVLRTRIGEHWQEEGWPGKGFLRRSRPILGCRLPEEVTNFAATTKKKNHQRLLIRNEILHLNQSEQCGYIID